ncbi:MAG: LuxR C-terminal-related transcriptional regulator [Raoultibacter sp.]
MLAALSEITITAAELFAHALFWTIVATAIRLQKGSPFRVIGFSTGLYDLISIIWITLFFSLGATNNAIILLVVFLVVSLLIWLADKSDAAQTTMPPEPIADKRQEIATRYALSPRETEVFMMLAQGRSRTYISEELFISDGTTKTHISHIYKKLEVSNKQEMFDILLQDQAEKTDKGHRSL